MKVILTNEVASLGSIGDVVNVRNGYARNFLLPRGLAALANEENQSALNHHKRVLEKRREKILVAAKELAAQIEKTSVTVSKQVGEDEKIFGSVTAGELEELLLAEGLKVSKKDITILDDIKKVGVYAAQVKLHAEVTPKFKVWVVAAQ
ncbi:MAG: 50S ribosomal protein L9 [Proteobacteria bacterium]|nr:50S ribosomal protein L9 [Pseudomonadota bacterium]